MSAHGVITQRERGGGCGELVVEGDFVVKQRKR